MPESPEKSKALLHVRWRLAHSVPHERGAGFAEPALRSMARLILSSLSEAEVLSLALDRCAELPALLPERMRDVLGLNPPAPPPEPAPPPAPPPEPAPQEAPPPEEALDFEARAPKVSYETRNRARNLFVTKHRERFQHEVRLEGRNLIHKSFQQEWRKIANAAFTKLSTRSGEYLRLVQEVALSVKGRVVDPQTGRFSSQASGRQGKHISDELSVLHLLPFSMRPGVRLSRRRVRSFAQALRNELGATTSSKHDGHVLVRAAKVAGWSRHLCERAFPGIPVSDLYRYGKDSPSWNRSFMDTFTKDGGSMSIVQGFQWHLQAWKHQDLQYEIDQEKPQANRLYLACDFADRLFFSDFS